MPISPDHRVTLVVTRRPLLEWKRTCVLLVESMALMKAALSTFDVERIILDRCATADEFLHLLSALPSELAGDVLFMREDGSGFISAIGRGGDRVLYALNCSDIDFYIEMHALTVSPEQLALTA